MKKGTKTSVGRPVVKIHHWFEDQTNDVKANDLLEADLQEHAGGLDNTARLVLATKFDRWAKQLRESAALYVAFNN